MLIKKIFVQVNDPLESRAAEFYKGFPTEDYNIDIRIGNGWLITGSYCNQTLMTVTLLKTNPLQDRI
jgi:hypothetical protein